MTPAARLRAAAQLARETAEAATPGPWRVAEGNRVWSGSPDDREHLADTFDSEPDAAHIALWSPLVALAVAAWLENTAVRLEVNHGGVPYAHALAVADALLQTQPVKP